ncbi:hypothetical protein E2C01_009951 [Portunus trituberculatus]|uniref:Uncharacterized protein n=1 Tax=Portunus trituberculatus TaxID=210409 RepID=A0A5B7D759_PORTR|nr:hypothetical protein [Portunus trituberculatus]
MAWFPWGGERALPAVTKGFASHMRVCVAVFLAGVAAVVMVVADPRPKPQRVGVQIDNNVLFTAGAGLLLAGLAFHAGRRSAYNEKNGGGSRTEDAHTTDYRNIIVFCPRIFAIKGQSGLDLQYDHYSPSGGSFGGFLPFRHRRHTGPEPLDPRMEQILEAALEKDPAGCVLQLTCAVGTIPPAALTGRIKGLHAILSSAGGRAQDVVSEYQAALSLGRRGGDCDRLFPRCPEHSPLLVDQFQTMEIVEYYPH